jgi:hypothetical protein
MSPSSMFRVAAVALAAALTLPGAAFALTSQANGMIHNWVSSDRCVASAQKQFPDYTPESLAKRDVALQQCLSSGVLPPRAPLAPQPGSRQ